jgi:uncharacterized protein YccT (UPF0319 family)
MPYKTRLITLFFSLLIGCSTQQNVRLYEGPALGESLEAKLILPVEFNLLSLDGRPVSSFTQGFRNQSLNIQLPAGPHTLVIQYEDIWEIDDENHEKITSGKLVIEANMEAQSTYTLSHPVLNSLEDAQAFSNHPKLVLKSNEQSFTASHIKKDNPLEFNTQSDQSEVELPRLEQLKYWWQQASQHERTQFIKWKDTIN